MLCQYFNISVDSLLNDDEEINDVTKVSAANNNKYNKMKRIAIIILKTCAILVVIYLVNYLLLILDNIIYGINIIKMLNFSLYFRI